MVNQDTASNTGMDGANRFKWLFGCFFLKSQFTHCCGWISRKTPSQQPHWEVNRCWFERLLHVKADVDRRDACLCWEADWDLLFFDERHNKITSLPLSTTNQPLCLCVLPLLSGAPRLLLQSVTKHKRGNLVTARSALKCVSSNPPPSHPSSLLGGV